MGVTFLVLAQIRRREMIIFEKIQVIFVELQRRGKLRIMMEETYQCISVSEWRVAAVGLERRGRHAKIRSCQRELEAE